MVIVYILGWYLIGLVTLLFTLYMDFRTGGRNEVKVIDFMFAWLGPILTILMLGVWIYELGIDASKGWESLSTKVVFRWKRDDNERL